MKLPIFIFAFLCTLNAFAQPGGMSHMIATMKNDENQFLSINEKLKTNPNNYYLIWEKVQLYSYQYYMRDNNLDIQHNEIYGKLAQEYDHFQYIHYTLEKRLNDINILIDNNAILKRNYNSRITNRIDFLLMRGSMYYMLGQRDKALEDFLFALNNIEEKRGSDDFIEIKKNICFAIAAYYYNASNTFISIADLDNYLHQALKYLDLMSPVEYIKNFDNINISSTIEHFEKEKIYIITKLQDHKRLEQYYLQLMLFYDKQYKKGGKYYVVLSYMADLSEYFYRKNNYAKAKFWIEKLLVINDNYPHINANNYSIDRCIKDRIAYQYYLLYRIYQTNEFKNIDKAINSLLNACANRRDNSYQFINYDIIDLIKLYPNDARLYLAQAFFIYYTNWTKNYDEENKLNATQTALQLLEKVELLNLKDYRIHFLRSSIYYYTLNKYDLALIEIEKAIALAPNYEDIHLLKHDILKKIDPNFQYPKINYQSYLPNLTLFLNTYIFYYCYHYYIFPKHY